MTHALLPHYQFSEHHQRLCHAPAGALLDAVPAADASTIPLLRHLMTLRELPARLRRHSAIAGRPPFGLHEFTPLARDGDHCLAFGLVGRFWRSDFGLVPIGDAAAFTAFRQPGIAKLLLTFDTRPQDNGCLLSTDTRVYCPDWQSRLYFTPYWLAIRLASGLIRQQILATIERQALRIQSTTNTGDNGATLHRR